MDIERAINIAKGSAKASLLDSEREMKEKLLKLFEETDIPSEEE